MWSKIENCFFLQFKRNIIKSWLEKIEIEIQDKIIRKRNLLIFLKGSLGKDNVSFSDESIFFRWANVISDLENFVRITENVSEIFSIERKIFRNSKIGMFVDVDECRAVFDDFILSCFVPKIESMIVIIENDSRNSSPDSSYKVLESDTFHEFSTLVDIGKNHFGSDLYIRKFAFHKWRNEKSFLSPKIIRKSVIAGIFSQDMRLQIIHISNCMEKPQKPKFCIILRDVALSS